MISAQMLIECIYDRVENGAVDKAEMAPNDHLAAEGRLAPPMLSDCLQMQINHRLFCADCGCDARVDLDLLWHSQAALLKRASGLDYIQVRFNKALG